MRRRPGCACALFGHRQQCVRASSIGPPGGPFQVQVLSFLQASLSLYLNHPSLSLPPSISIRYFAISPWQSDDLHLPTYAQRGTEDGEHGRWTIDPSRLRQDKS
jgi:hypothetical protein